MRYSTRDNEAGCVIDDFATLKEAEKAIEGYEKQIKKMEHMKRGFMKFMTMKNKRS